MRFDRDLHLWLLEVGDRVIIKPYDELVRLMNDASLTRVGINDYMISYAGEEVTIQSVSFSAWNGKPYYRLCEHDWKWTEEMFIIPSPHKPKISKMMVEAISILQNMRDDGLCTSDAFEACIKLLKTNEPNVTEIINVVQIMTTEERCALRVALSRANPELWWKIEYPVRQISKILNYFVE